MIERFRSSQGEFRRLRAATYFAHGGSSSQSHSTPFRLVAKTALVPLLLLFPANPLRWASPGGTREITQNATGDAADGLGLRFAPPRSIGPLSPDPITGVILRAGKILPARKIWSEFLNSRRATGPWVCGKLRPVRFHNRAWRCRANAPASKHGYLIRPLRGHLPLKGKAEGVDFRSLPL